jgi:hypothetical protein
MSAFQDVPAYMSPDQSDQQMPYYKHHSKLRPFRHMHTAVRSQCSGKMIKEQILVRLSLKSDITEIVNYYIQTAVLFTVSHSVTSKLG